MKDASLNFFKAGHESLGSCKWVIESSSPYDLYYKMGITKFDRIFLAYKLEHYRNVAQFYERLLDKWDRKNNFYMLIQRNIEHARYILNIVDKGLAGENIVTEVPDELMSLYNNWGWVKTGFGVNEGGLISHYYGITTDGILLHILDKAIFMNMSKVYYIILTPYNNEPYTGNLLNAIFSTETALDIICDPVDNAGSIKLM